jgi:hypothetical protein
MQTQSAKPLTELFQQFSSYLPTFAAGLLVLAFGVAAGWLAKKAVGRLLIWLRLDRLAGRVGWRSALGKGDVRAALYNLIGNVTMAVIVLLFLDQSLRQWRLTALSGLIDNVVFYLPNLGLVVLIVVVGLVIANGLGERVTSALEEEGVAHARFVGKLFKAALLFVVAALGLWQLQFARQVVLAAFLIAFGSVGVAFALGVGLGSTQAVRRAWELFLERRTSSENARRK